MVNHSKATINSYFDNASRTFVKRFFFFQTKPNWNQYETFWKRYVFAGLLAILAFELFSLFVVELGFPVWDGIWWLLFL